MTADCRVGSIGIEQRNCERPSLGRWERLTLPTAVLLALVLMGGLVIINAPLMRTPPEADLPGNVAGDDGGVAVERGATFDFLDHELEHAGGYTLRPALGPGLTIGDASDPVQVSSLDARKVVGTRRIDASPLAGPEYWVGRSRSGTAGVAEEAVRSGTSFVGPEYWVGLSQSGSRCKAWSEALARYHQAKPVQDPANGASSAAEAEFYVAQYGAGDASIAALEEDLRESVCEA